MDDFIFNNIGFSSWLFVVSVSVITATIQYRLKFGSEHALGVPLYAIKQIGFYSLMFVTVFGGLMSKNTATVYFTNCATILIVFPIVGFFCKNRFSNEPFKFNDLFF